MTKQLTKLIISKIVVCKPLNSVKKVIQFYTEKFWFGPFKTKILVLKNLEIILRMGLIVTHFHITI